jgi:hypothetical protein
MLPMMQGNPATVPKSLPQMLGRAVRGKNRSICSCSKRRQRFTRLPGPTLDVRESQYDGICQLRARGARSSPARNSQMSPRNFSRSNRRANSRVWRWVPPKFNSSNRKTTLAGEGLPCSWLGRCAKTSIAHQAAAAAADRHEAVNGQAAAEFLIGGGIP